MKKLLIIYFLILITQINAYAKDINPEYKKEKIELCTPWEESKKFESLSMDCISGSTNLFPKESMDLALDFSKKIQYAYKTQDVEMLSNIITYPLFIREYKGNKFLKIESKEEFLKLDKDILLNREIYKKIKKNKLFWNWKGFMLGEGSIWFWVDTQISNISFNLKNSTKKNKKG